MLKSTRFQVLAAMMKLLIGKPKKIKRMRSSTKLRQAISALGTRAQTEAIRAWEKHSLREMLARSTAQLVSKAGPQIWA